MESDLEKEWFPTCLHRGPAPVLVEILSDNFTPCIERIGRGAQPSGSRFCRTPRCPLRGAVHVQLSANFTPRRRTTRAPKTKPLIVKDIGRSYAIYSAALSNYSSMRGINDR